MIAILSTWHGGGTGAYIVLNEMLKHWPQREKLLIVTPATSMIRETAGHRGISCLPTPVKQDRFIYSMTMLPWLAGKLNKRVTGIHAWHTRGYESAILLGRLLNIKTTCTIHDHPHTPSFKGRRYRLFHWAVPRFDQAAFVSYALYQSWHKEIEMPQYRIIHNGLPEITTKARSASQPVVIGFAAMYGALKGFTIIRKWIEETISRENVEWRLYGKVCESFRNEAEHLAHFHPDKVTLCGWRDPKDIYRNIDILVHASILFDSLPTTLIEAAQHGLPVVASSHGGAPEIVDDGKSGYLFDPSTPEQGFRYLKTLIKDPTLRTNMGNRAKELFRQRFSVRQMVAKYEDFWQIHEA